MVALLGLLMLAGNGCKSDGADGGIQRRYFGVTTVTLPVDVEAADPFTVSDVSNFGVMAGNGSFALGYNRSRDVILPPDGGIYIEVQTDEQLDALVAFLNQQTNKNIWIIKTKK